MLDNGRIKNAAAHLLYCRQTRRQAEIPETCRPGSRAEGYLIQAQLEILSGQPVVGWKIAATSVAGQEHIGVDGPLAGRIFADMLHREDTPIDLKRNSMRKLELEFAFCMDKDLPPRAEPYAREEVLAAVRSLHLSLEIPDSRYADPSVMGAPMLIADNACAHCFVIGPEVRAAWRTMELAEQAVYAVVNGREKISGKGLNVLECPTKALTWLANELSAHDVTLRAGQTVSTGTCVSPVDVAPGDSVLADFGELGKMRICFV